MNGWEKDKLDNLCKKIQSGGTPKSDRVEYYGGDIPFVTIEDITASKKYLQKTKRTITVLGLNDCAAWVVPKNSVMYSIYATIGEPLINEIEAATNQAILNIITDNQKINSEFLYYFLLNIKSEVYKYSAQTTQSNLNAAIVKSFEIAYPSLPEQTRIAQILSQADEAIAHTEALIAKYQRIKTGLMQDLLTRGIDEQGQIRSEATHPFKDSPLGRIPEEWEVVMLGFMVEAIDPQPDHRTPPSVEMGVPYLGINDIDALGNIDYRKCRKVSLSVLEEHKARYQLRRGDIIFGKIGTVGSPKRLIKTDNITLSANLILIQPKNSNDFVYWLLNSDFVERQVKDSIHSTSQPAYGIEKIRKIVVPLPKQNEQELIATRLNCTNSSIQQQQSHLAKLQSIKRGLMQDLLSGRVRVHTPQTHTTA